jgi:hypothetical protein
VHTAFGVRIARRLVSQDAREAARRATADADEAKQLCVQVRHATYNMQHATDTDATRLSTHV